MGAQGKGGWRGVTELSQNSARALAGLLKTGKQWRNAIETSRVGISAPAVMGTVVGMPRTLWWPMGV